MQYWLNIFPFFIPFQIEVEDKEEEEKGRIAA